MSARLCKICDQEVDNDKFGQHIDGHSDSELARWPGGTDDLRRQLISSMRESEGA